MRIKTKFNLNGYLIDCRPGKLSDRNFVLNLLKKTIFQYVAEYFEPSIEMFDERFAKDYYEKRILLRGKRRIGYFQLTEKDNRFLVTGIFLSPAYQGKGIAKYLMLYFEEIALSLGYEEINLSVWDNNPAVKFYEKLGYVIIGKKGHKFLMRKNVTRGRVTVTK